MNAILIILFALALSFMFYRLERNENEDQQTIMWYKIYKYISLIIGVVLAVGVLFFG
jgi:uncharacterized membrane protein